MQVRIPFVGDNLSGEELWEEAYKNEKETLSGVYPLVVRRMWHTGIHLSNKNDEDNGEEPDYSKNFIKPIVDGEIIAYKLAKDYDTLPLESSEIRNSNYRNIGALIDKLENAQKYYSRLYDEIASIAPPDERDVVGNVVAKIIDTKTNIEGLTEALSRVLTPFSTSFVLTRHKLKLNNEKEITYFILYSNLAPISDYTLEREACRAFFRKWVLKNTEKLDTQLVINNVAKLNLYDQAGCTDRPSGCIDKNGQVTLYQGAYSGDDLNVYKDADGKYVNNTGNLITNVDFAGAFKLQSSADIPLYYDKERKYLKCTVNASASVFIEGERGQLNSESLLNKLFRKNERMEEQEQSAIITFNISGYENERTYSSYLLSAGQGLIIVPSDNMDDWIKQVDDKWFYIGTNKLNIYDNTNGTDTTKFTQKTFQNDYVYLHKNDIFEKDGDGQTSGSNTILKIKRVGCSYEGRCHQEYGYLGEKETKARDILEAVYYANINLPAIYNENTAPEGVTVEQGFPLYAGEDSNNVERIVFLSGITDNVEVLNTGNQAKKIYKIAVENKTSGEKIEGFAELKGGDVIERTTEQGYYKDDDNYEVCICDPPIPTADIDYLGMQGFIYYNNGVHIELFMPSLEGFKTSSRSIDHADIQNEIYCFKGGSSGISMREGGEISDKEPPDAGGGTPVIIVYNNAGGNQQRRNVTSGYNMCRYGELLEKTLSVNTNGRSTYWFFVGNNRYNLKFEVVPNSLKYIRLESYQDVQLDGGGWLIPGEKYLADNLQNDPDSPFEIKINVLKEKLGGRPVWYAFSKDLDDCKETDIETIKSSNYRIQSYNHLPEQRYSKNFREWGTLRIETNPFPAGRTRIRYSDTVRTGTGDDGIVRIKYNNNYYFFRSNAAVRINLSSNIAYRDYSITQYHVLGLPFFNKLEDEIKDLKYDVEGLHGFFANEIEKGLASMTAFNDPENFASAVYRREGLYKALNTVIVQCPSYWEYKDDIRPGYYGFSFSNNSQREKYKEYIGKQLWMTDEVKEAMGVSGKTRFFYFHPINFLKYVCSELRIEFNPYERKIIRNLGGYPDIEVKSNPGFAPILEKRSSSGFLGPDGTMYAYITRGMVKKPDGPEDHAGVDFGTNQQHSPIKSFIYGTVWAVTWQGNIIENNEAGGPAYGYVLIVKNDRENILYLLGHLSEILVRVGDRVIPGQVVANTGSTGNSSGPHLHLEVRLCSLKKEDVILPSGNEKEPNSQNDNGLNWSNPMPIVDPFDHDKTY
jgi:hypothetical protein